MLPSTCGVVSGSPLRSPRPSWMPLDARRFRSVASPAASWGSMEDLHQPDLGRQDIGVDRDQRRLVHQPTAAVLIDAVIRRLRGLLRRLLVVEEILRRVPIELGPAAGVGHGRDERRVEPPRVGHHGRVLVDRLVDRRRGDRRSGRRRGPRPGSGSCAAGCPARAGRGSSGRGCR